MRTLDRVRQASRFLFLILVSGGLAGSTTMGDEAPAVASQKSHKLARLLAKKKAPSVGTLGYGPPGLHPGYQ